MGNVNRPDNAVQRVKLARQIIWDATASDGTLLNACDVLEEMGSLSDIKLSRETRARIIAARNAPDMPRAPGLILWFLIGVLAGAVLWIAATDYLLIN